MLVTLLNQLEVEFVFLRLFPLLSKVLCFENGAYVFQRIVGRA
jgi:hypothetical protein